MINTVLNFFYMNGYGVYVFSAYSAVLIFLSIQLFIPWQRFRSFLRAQKHNNE